MGPRICSRQPRRASLQFFFSLQTTTTAHDYVGTATCLSSAHAPAAYWLAPCVHYY